jgi:hypothetical protein
MQQQATVQRPSQKAPERLDLDPIGKEVGNAQYQTRRENERGIAA